MLQRRLAFLRHCPVSTRLAFNTNCLASIRHFHPTIAKMTISSISDDRKAFVTFFETTIKKDLQQTLEHYRVPQNGRQWVTEMLDYTIPGGKMNRGLTVASALNSILQHNKSQVFKTDNLQHLSFVLGWCVEMLQAFFLIADDIMDGSVTRRSKPCWYKTSGMVAINDAFIVESVIYQLLKKHLRHHPSYVDVLELFHDVTYQTELGQLMDLITAPEDKVDLSKFSIQKHAYIVEYKTAYYSFYLPIALAMRLAGITGEEAYSQALAVLLPLGEYFQVQDDYLDCYGAPEVIGKIGTDIEDNKCGWLIVQALDLASPEQRVILENNYGKKSPENVARVKQVYKDLDIEGVYNKYEEESYKRISSLIDKIDESLLPRDMFVKFMDRIYKRTL